MSWARQYGHFLAETRKNLTLPSNWFRVGKITSVSNFAFIYGDEWLSLPNCHKSFLIRLISNRTHFCTEVAVSFGPQNEPVTFLDQARCGFGGGFGTQMCSPASITDS
ncbi:MAG: hypothetical protein CBC15_07945 [Candidatus Endolissoclinum sp. TMED55]|nr:MAG: hypothetical protein CBC15_07945 [Candidatus Endolissoclinum sp. TMED55]